ncbi:hypothetical protein ACIRBX_11830 [Kitasatospora sp. NPDC096147]|uniref:hypothetical protein n=1 Tax=Kitasatospora sp. NPDC096147 TaxID=3364093 RepID=UPI00381DFA64
MTYPDPFDPTSPWDEPAQNTPTNPTQEAPMTETTPTQTSSSAPFKIGFTLKAGSGFDAPWITPAVWGHDASETADRGVALLNALKGAGLIDLTAKAAEYTQSRYQGAAPSQAAQPTRFEGGKVVPASNSAGPADDDCAHGRKLVEKGSWAALFCQAREKSDQCEPLWRQKDGSYKAK